MTLLGNFEVRGVTVDRIMRVRLLERRSSMRYGWWDYEVPKITVEDRIGSLTSVRFFSMGSTRGTGLADIDVIRYRHTLSITQMCLPRVDKLTRCRKYTDLKLHVQADGKKLHQSL